MKSQKALQEFLKAKKADGWKMHHRDAAHAGWEYIMDMTCTNDGYDIKRLNGSSGQSEAYDMAASSVEERPWRGLKDQEACADYIYDGMVAAMKWVREQSLDKLTEASEELGLNE